MSEGLTVWLKRYFSADTSTSESDGVSLLKNIPANIRKEIADRTIKRPIQALVPKSSLEGYNPPVFISYATGTRPGKDEDTCGPGMYYCKALVDGLLDVGCETFTGLHILPGYNWEIYLSKLEKNVARILLVVMTPAVFLSRPCLNEIYISLKNGMKVIPLVFEYPFSCPDPWPHPDDADKREYVSSELKMLNSYPVPPSTMLDYPDYHLRRVFQLVNSTLISILTREALLATTDAADPYRNSSDSEPSLTEQEPPFKIISFNLGRAPLAVRRNCKWEAFLKAEADDLEWNVNQIYKIATKKNPSKKCTAKVNPFCDPSGMERAIIKLQFRHRIKNHLTPDEYEEIMYHLENIRELLTDGLLEALGKQKSDAETEQLLAKIGFPAVWPGSLNIMVQAPSIILDILHGKLLISDDGIPVGQQTGGDEVRILQMDPVFEVVPQSREVAAKLTKSLTKAFKSSPQEEANLYVIGHGPVGMIIPDTIENALEIFEEASSLRLDGKFPKVLWFDMTVVSPPKTKSNKPHLGMEVDISKIPGAFAIPGEASTPRMTDESLCETGAIVSSKSESEETGLWAEKEDERPPQTPAIAKNESKLFPLTFLAMEEDDDGIPIIPLSDNDNKTIVLETCQRSGLALKYASKKLRNDKRVVQTACRQNGLALQYASNLGRYHWQFLSFTSIINGWRFGLRNNQKVVQTACEQNGLALEFASIRLRNNPDVIESACRQNGLALQFTSQEWRNDIAIGYIACGENGLALQYASTEVRNDRYVVINACCQNGLALQYASEKLRNDEAVVQISCHQNQLALQYASRELRNDKELVQIVCERNGLALQYASEELRNNRKVVRSACKQNGMALQYASSELRNDNNVVVDVHRQKGVDLKYASREFDSDYHAVMVACQQNGLALQYSSKPLSQNKSVVLVACRQNGLALQYASEDLRNDIQVVLSACGQNGLALQYASEELRNANIVVMNACRQHGLALKYASQELHSDWHIVQVACRQNGFALQSASEELRNDSYMVKRACRQNGLALQYASAKLRNDRNVVKCACRQNGLALQYASEELRNSSSIVTMSACEQNGLALQYVPKEFQNDREVVIAACRQNGLALQYASKKLRNQMPVVLSACQQNGLAFQYASKELRNDKAFLETIQQLEEARMLTGKLEKTVFDLMDPMSDYSEDE